MPRIVRFSWAASLLLLFRLAFAAGNFDDGERGNPVAHHSAGCEPIKGSTP
jgi:hypothetical protein